MPYANRNFGRNYILAALSGAISGAAVDITIATGGVGLVALAGVAANYGMGLLIGNQGFKGGEYFGIRGMVTRMYLKNSILTPFQWIFDGIMDSMW